ncbi:MAG: hypothetical protein GY787_14425 [Alteromonadales bacterium]|nr:hypothetical protein [Alteromonadales bacterium]
MNITGKYLKVWKKETNDYGTTVDLGESKKKYNADGYDNWTWFKCKLKGNAANVNINEGDKVEVKSGIMKQFKTDAGKWLNDIVIFEIEVMEQSNQGNNQQSNSSQSYQKTTQSSQNFEDDIPF